MSQGFEDIEIQLKIGRVAGQCATLHFSVVGKADGATVSIIALDNEGRRNGVEVMVGRYGLTNLREMLDRVEGALAKAKLELKP